MTSNLQPLLPCPEGTFYLSSDVLTPPSPFFLDPSTPPSKEEEKEEAQQEDTAMMEDYPPHLLSSINSLAYDTFTATPTAPPFEQVYNENYRPVMGIPSYYWKPIYYCDDQQ